MAAPLPPTHLLASAAYCPQSIPAKRSSRRRRPLVVHIAVGQHAIAIQQQDGSILGGLYLAVRLLVGAQQDSFSQNRAEHKQHRDQAQHGHNIPMQLPIPVEGTRCEALTARPAQQPQRHNQMQQIRQHKANVAHHLMGGALAAHHIHEELIETPSQNVQQRNAHNAEHLLRLDHVRCAGQVHHQHGGEQLRYL